MSYTYLKNSGIDAGSKIDLLVRNVTYAWQNFTPSPEIPGKNTGSSYDFRLAEVDYLGHANPIITVEGIIRLGNDLNDDGSVAITMERMGSFLMIGSDSVFYDDGLVMNPAGSTMVVPQSFKAVRNVSSAGRKDLGDIINYNLILRETKKW